MRMWMQNPEIYCRQHLLGSHVELHILASHLKRCKSLGGYVREGLIETRLLLSQHELIVGEMLRRGYKHRSPLRLDAFFRSLDIGRVNTKTALSDLLARCSECRKRYELFKGGLLEQYEDCGCDIEELKREHKTKGDVRC